MYITPLGKLRTVFATFQLIVLPTKRRFLYPNNICIIYTIVLFIIFLFKLIYNGHTWKRKKDYNSW